MVKYIAATGNIRAANKLCRVINGVITATGATAVAVFKTGGSSGTTVADIRTATSGDSFWFQFTPPGLVADHVTLTNCVVMLDIEAR